MKKLILTTIFVITVFKLSAQEHKETATYIEGEKQEISTGYTPECEDAIYAGAEYYKKTLESAVVTGTGHVTYETDEEYLSNSYNFVGAKPEDTSLVINMKSEKPAFIKRVNKPENRKKTSWRWTT